MSPIEDYLWSNNIQVWGYRVADRYVYFNTSEGLFIQNEMGYLYKESENLCERVV